MRVEGERIDAIESEQRPAPAFAEYGRAAVGRVGVQPQAFGGAVSGELGRRVNRAGGGGAGVRDDAEGTQAQSAVVRKPPPPVRGG